MSHLREAAQQVVITVGQFHDGSMIGKGLIDLIDSHVEIEEQSSLAVVAHHTLHPEERCEADAARHRFDVVQAARRVNHHIAGREFDRMLAVDVVDHQLAAVVVFRRAEKQRRRDIGANAIGRAGNLADGIVQMRAEGLAAFVAVEERREDPERQRRGDEQRVALQGPPQSYRLAPAPPGYVPVIGGCPSPWPIDVRR